MMTDRIKPVTRERFAGCILHCQGCNVQLVGWGGGIKWHDPTFGLEGMVPQFWTLIVSLQGGSTRKRQNYCHQTHLWTGNGTKWVFDSAGFLDPVAGLRGEERQLSLFNCELASDPTSSSQLVIRRTRLSTVGDRAFPVAGCRLWNRLPSDVASATTLSVFRNRLKTHLFSRSFAS